ncbi:MAG: hypothetical protein WDA27_15150 [Actinomycetota bacterium]
MKQAICTTAEDAKAIQAEDNAKAKLPWKGVFADGSPAPEGWGVTTSLYDVQAKPDGKAWAYPVSDTAATEAKPGDPIKEALIVDKLDATWDAKAEPIEEPKPVEEPVKEDDFAVPVGK